MLILSSIIVSLAFLQPVLSWGELGHRTVAYLAQKYFTAEASSFVETLLANNKGYDISDAALFADAVRDARPTTGVWHYIDALDNPPSWCGVNYTRDCNINKDPGCVVSAIKNMTIRVNDPRNSFIDQKEALMFLIHFIGDIHQPLHTENKSRGGNDIPVCFNRACTKVSLHSVWDTRIPNKHRGLDSDPEKNEIIAAAAEWASDLFALNQETGLSAAAECSDITTAETCALRWANEANYWICKYVLAKLPAKDPSTGKPQTATAYFDKAVPIVDELVAKAGLRLGAWVNALAAARGPITQDDFVVQRPDDSEDRLKSTEL